MSWLSDKFDSLTGDGLFGAVGGIASGVLGAISGNRQQKKQNEYNYEMWQLQNQYNSPKEQMQRLKEAGLNPYLYAEGLASNSANAPVSVAGYQGDYGVGSAISNANNYGNRKREYEIRKEELERKQKRDILDEEVIRKTVLNNDILDLNKKMKQQELKNMQQSFNKTSKEIQLAELAHDLNLNKYEFQKKFNTAMYNLEKKKFDKREKKFGFGVNAGDFGYWGIGLDSKGF